jgi:hypothetical protein
LLGTAADRALFVDRASERKRLETAIGTRTNTLVLGERGVGKTSLLRTVASELQKTANPIWVEGRLANDPVELLSLVRYRIDPQEKLDYGASVARGLAAFQYRRPPQSQQLLELVSDLEKTARRRKVQWTIFLDELASAETAHVLFGRLRDELWQLPLTWIVAANTADQATLLRPPADAFFPNVMKLEPLDQKDALVLLRKRIPPRQARDSLLKQIVAEARGNPRRLLTLATEGLVEGRDIEVTSNAHARRTKAIAELGEAAQRVADELEANGPASASDEEFLSRLGMKRSRAAQILAELERAGIASGMTERVEGRRPRKIYALVSQ